MEKRVIKFRAFDKKTKKMSPEFVLFGEFLLMGALHSWQYEMGNRSESSLEALDDLEIMQFTGLKDKNGVEIYEGDIVHIQYNHFGNKAVAWEQIGRWNISAYNLSKCKVIGNIYQNAELLTNQS